MAWESVTCTMLRHLINDVDGALYSDERLNTAIAVSAFLVKQDIGDSTYTINVNSPSITPDPTAAGSLDNGFINLVVLRSAWFMYASMYREAASQSFSIKDGPATIDTKSRAEAYKDLSETYERMYGNVKMNYLSGEGDAGSAIMTPYTQERLSPGRFI